MMMRFIKTFRDSKLEMQKGDQYSSSSFIIEISPPGGKKSGRSKVLSGRFGICQQYGHQ